MAATRVSELEAVRVIAGLLTRVRAGEEIVIEANARPVAVLRPATERAGRLLSESIRLAQAHTAELGMNQSWMRTLLPIWKRFSVIDGHAVRHGIDS